MIFNFTDFYFVQKTQLTFYNGNTLLPFSCPNLSCKIDTKHTTYTICEDDTSWSTFTIDFEHDRIAGYCNYNPSRINTETPFEVLQLHNNKHQLKVVSHPKHVINRMLSSVEDEIYYYKKIPCIGSDPNITYGFQIGYTLTKTLYDFLEQDEHAVKFMIGSTNTQMNMILRNQVNIELFIHHILVFTSDTMLSFTSNTDLPSTQCNDEFFTINSMSANQTFSVSEKLDQLREWSSCINYDNVGSWQLIDYRPSQQLGGIGYVGTACNFISFQVGITYYGAGFWKTVLHELGHNLNLLHPLDPITDDVATENVGIMGYGFGDYNNTIQFSPESLNELCPYVNALYEHPTICTKDVLFAESEANPICGNGLLEIGEQCESSDNANCCDLSTCTYMSDEVECVNGPCCNFTTCSHKTFSTSCIGDLPNSQGVCGSDGHCFSLLYTNLYICSTEEDSCTFGLKDGLDGQCRTNYWLAGGKSIHIMEQGSYCTLPNNAGRGQCDGDTEVCRSIVPTPPTSKPTPQPTTVLPTPQPTSPTTTPPSPTPKPTPAPLSPVPIPTIPPITTTDSISPTQSPTTPMPTSISTPTTAVEPLADWISSNWWVIVTVAAVIVLLIVIVFIALACIPPYSNNTIDVI